MLPPPEYYARLAEEMQRRSSQASLPFVRDGYARLAREWTLLALMAHGGPGASPCEATGGVIHVDFAANRCRALRR